MPRHNGVTKAIREQLRANADRKRDLLATVEAVDGDSERLERALSLIASTNGSNGEAKANGNRRKVRRRRSAGPMATRGERRNQVLDVMRQHPNAEFSASKLKAEFGIPHSSGNNAIEDLLASGWAKKVGETERGLPIVLYRPTTVRPGEPVAA